MSSSSSSSNRSNSSDTCSNSNTTLRDFGVDGRISVAFAGDVGGDVGDGVVVAVGSGVLVAVGGGVAVGVGVIVGGIGVAVFSEAGVSTAATSIARGDSSVALGAPSADELPSENW